MSSRVCLFAFLIAVALSARAAAQVKVYVKFPAGVPDADKTSMFDHIKAQYAFLGADITFTTDAAAAKDLTVCLVDDFAPKKGSVWGDSSKKNHTCNTYRKEFTGDAAVTGKLTAAQLVRAQADTMAHELGHLLCATHNWNAPASRKAKDDTGKEKAGNGKAVDLMTNGGKVSIAERGAGRSFVDAAKEQIKMGVKMLKDKKSWDLKAPDARTAICLVPGRSETMHGENEDDPTDVIKGQADVDIMAMMWDAGPALLAMNLDMGFVSDENQFVPIVTDHLDDPSGQTGFFLFEPGEIPTFALGGEEGTSPAGMFWEPASIQFSDPISPSFADMSLPGPYFRQALLSYDVNNDSQPDVFMQLSTSILAQTNGFKAIPEPGALWLASLVAAGMAAACRRRAG